MLLARLLRWRRGFWRDLWLLLDRKSPFRGNARPRSLVAAKRCASLAPPRSLAIGQRTLRKGVRARVAELVDALDLGSSVARRGGSTPSARTNAAHSLSGGQTSMAFLAQHRCGVGHHEFIDGIEQ